MAQPTQEQLQAAYNQGYNERKKDENTEKLLQIQEEFKKLRLELRMQGANQHIRTFNGEGSDRFNTWVTDIERTITQLGGDDSRGITLALQTLSGPAAEFATREVNANEGITWKQLKKKLGDRYNDMSDTAFAKQKLRRIVQGKSESIQNFYERLMTAARSAFDNDKLKDEYVQQQLVEYFLDGLTDDNMVRKLIRKKPTKMAKALEYATEEQQVQRSFEIRRGNVPDMEHTPMEVNALGTGQRNSEMAEMMELLKEILYSIKKQEHAPIYPRRNYVPNPDYNKECYRCHRTGHIAVNCRAPIPHYNQPKND